MPNKLTRSDIYDIDPKSGALIIGSNRLDDYATKFLNKYCAKALTTPMPLPVEEMLRDAKLTVETASLSRNLDVFGCCMLLDGHGVPGCFPMDAVHHLGKVRVGLYATIPVVCGHLFTTLHHITRDEPFPAVAIGPGWVGNTVMHIARSGGRPWLEVIVDHIDVSMLHQKPWISSRFV